MNCSLFIYFFFSTNGFARVRNPRVPYAGTYFNLHAYLNLLLVHSKFNHAMHKPHTSAVYYTKY